MRRTRIEKRLWAALFVCAAVASLAQPAEAVVISEVLPVGVGETPAYVELDALPDTPFSLIVLDGSPSSSRNRRVKSTTTIHAPGHDLVVVHEGVWPHAPIISALYIGVDDLDLTIASGNSARRLVAFDTAVDWPVGGNAPALNTWGDSGSTVPGFDAQGVVTIQMGSVTTTIALGETVHTLSPGDGLTRHVAANRYTDRFSAGPVDTNLRFIDSISGLDPGERNDEVNAPEPATSALLLIGGGALVGRPKKNPQRVLRANGQRRT